MIVLAIGRLLENQPFEPFLRRGWVLDDPDDLPDDDDERVGEGDVPVPYPFPVLLDGFLATFDAHLPKIELHGSHDLGTMTAGGIVDRDVHAIEMRAQADALDHGRDPMQLHHRPFQPQAHPDDFGVVAGGELGNAELESRAVEGAVEEIRITGKGSALNGWRIEAERMTKVLIDVGVILRRHAVAELFLQDGEKDGIDFVDRSCAVDIAQPGAVEKIERRELANALGHVLARAEIRV